MAKSKLCYCGSGKLFDDCCVQIHQGLRVAATPEELMRSRYTAYAINNLSYIENTMCGVALEEYNKHSSTDNVEHVKWLKLEIITSNVEESTAIVEFKAFYRANKRKYCLHEVSEFQFINGKWLYSAAREFIE